MINNMQNEEGAMSGGNLDQSFSPGVTRTNPSIPMEPSNQQGGEMSQEQMIANLQDLASKIETKYQDFNSQKFASANKLEVKKREALKEVFDIMETAGIDLTNPEEVKGFLDSLKEKNPELYQIVEQSLEALFSEGAPAIGEPSAVPPVAEEEGGYIPPSGLEQNNMNMNPNENLSQNI